MAILIRRRRDSATNWSSVDPIIPNGQLAFEIGTAEGGAPRIKFGDGATAFSALPYINRKNNLTATLDPTITNNATENYAVGSFWVNTILKRGFILTSFSGVNAIWTPLGGLVRFLSQIQDVPAYNNDGNSYSLVETNGMLTWELYGPGGGPVVSVNGQTGAVVLTEQDTLGVAAESLTLSGAVNISLSTNTDMYLKLTGNTTITFTNTPPVNTSIVRTYSVKSTTTQTLGIANSTDEFGTYTANGTLNEMVVKASNYATEGLIIRVFFSQPN
jgi:hypothetical protein